MPVGGREMLVTLEVRYTHKHPGFQMLIDMNGTMLRINEKLSMVHG